MRKPKRPLEWEDEGGASKKLGIGVETSDDEIIDLDDIIELHDDSLDGEELDDGEVELLDADGDLDLHDLDDVGADDDLDDDFLKNLSLPGSDGIGPASETEREFGEELDDSDRYDPLLEFEKEFSDSVNDSTSGMMKEAADTREGTGFGDANGSLDSLQGFVAQIETRLLDAVRELVEMKLPDIVRSVLTEEIERMKEEQE